MTGLQAPPRRTTTPGADVRERAKRLALAALALAVVVAVAFWLVGALRGPTTVTDDGAGASLGAEPAGDDPTADDADDAGDAGAPAADTAGTPRAEAADTAGTASGDVSIQVLDAVLDDGGAAAARLADRSRADGYDVVVVHTAARPYEDTTVFFTPGHRAEAQQVADTYDIAVVKPKPASLSDTVDVHLVVGADRSDPGD